MHDTMRDLYPDAPFGTPEGADSWAHAEAFFTYSPERGPTVAHTVQSAIELVLRCEAGDNPAMVY